MNLLVHQKNGAKSSKRWIDVFLQSFIVADLVFCLVLLNKKYINDIKTGMGNRFRNNGRYHKLITAHGILAATIFLGLVPVSTMILRFYTFRPWMALRIHIWSQLLSLVLCTACIATGCIATGSKRSLTNPHHGIGLAVYILMYVNLVWGFAVHLRTRGKRFMHIPMSILVWKRSQKTEKKRKGHA